MPDHSDDIIPLHLRQAYNDKLEEYACILESCIASYRRGETVSDDTLDNVADVAHKLAGSGKIYGFDHLSTAGMTLDCYLIEHTMDNDRFIQLVSDLYNAVQNALNKKE